MSDELEQDAPAASPELDQAIAEAIGVQAEIDGTAGTGQAADVGGEPPSSVSTAQELEIMLKLARAFPYVAKNLPRVAAELQDEPIAAFAEAGGAVLDKYGISLGGMGEKWGIELRALFVCGGFIWAVGNAARADLDALRAANAKDVSPAPDRPAETAQGPNPFSYGAAAQ